MTTVPFTHFYHPNGRQENETIELGDEVAPKLKEIQDLGLRLTAEVLQNSMSGMCSFCIEHRELGDYDMELTENGPDVPKKITAMLLRFDRATFNEWKARQEKLNE